MAKRFEDGREQDTLRNRHRRRYVAHRLRRPQPLDHVRLQAHEKSYNLMQAIARVNRVYKDKEGGLVVDYVGIANALKSAMRDYTKRDQKKYGDMDIGKTAYPKSPGKARRMPRQDVRL